MIEGGITHGNKMYHKRLREIQDDVLVMGSLVSEAILRSVDSLKDRNLDLAHQIVAGDQKINDLRFDIEEKCIQLIVTQQPIANDLRIIIAVLNIITEVERIGDYAEGIAQIAIMIGDEPPVKQLIDIPLMAEQAVDMLRRSLEAFINQDADAARQICNEDDIVDHLYDKICLELLTLMMADLQIVSRATRLIWVAHDLERSADRVTNICERVIFVITGKMEEI
jgi:phosphate transport system protein